MVSGARIRRVLSWFLLGAALNVAAGCRTSSRDIERWTETKQGPRKLVAVLSHDKYPLGLRLEAATALIEMKPRAGKRIGIFGEEGDSENVGLIGALAALSPTESARIISKLTPRLVAEIRRTPTPAQAGQPTSPDPSVPYKDAAFALLTHEPAPLVSAEGDRQQLEQALADWATTNFAERVDDSSQVYGVEQVLRYVKAGGVRRLPALLDVDGKKNDLIARLVADLGSRETKLAASQRFVVIATDVASDAWKERKAPSVRAANEASKLKISDDRFRAQLEQYQQEELVRVFSSMKRIGGAPIVAFLLDYARNEGNAPERRAAALAALEGNLAGCGGAAPCEAHAIADIEIVMSIAKSDSTPDDVREQALRRIGEMPRKVVVLRLYELFDNQNWKIRWKAADLVLRMSSAADLPEFMSHLAKNHEGMAISEPQQYGLLIGQLKGTPRPEEQVDGFAAKGQDIAVRLSALAYYFHYGQASQLDRLLPFEDDSSKVPQCREDAQGCEWKCIVTDGTAEELKDVATLGDYVKYCVRPAMQKRTKVEKKSEP